MYQTISNNINPRLYDTTSNGTGRMGVNQTRTIQVTGRIGIPTRATAAIVNLTAAYTTGIGFLNLYQANTANPVSNSIIWDEPYSGSNVNTITTNLVLVPLSNGGAINITLGGSSNSSTDIIIDVLGYIDPSITSNSPGFYYPVTPTRLYNTGGQLNAGATRTIQIAGYANVPSTATSVVLRIQTQNVTGITFLSLFAGPPFSWQGNSTIDPGAGQSLGNLAIVPINNGQINIYNGVNATDFSIDVVGFFVNCNNPANYLFPPVWSVYYRGWFYWDGSVDGYFNDTILSGMETWHKAPYRSPIFELTGDNAIAQGVVKFDTIPMCGAVMQPLACTSVDNGNQSWSMVFNNTRNPDDTFYYCFVSLDEGAVPGCYNIGHVTNHEYGHVMTMNENPSNTSSLFLGYDSLISQVYTSDSSKGVIRVRGCGDNKSLYVRYGV